MRRRSSDSLDIKVCIAIHKKCNYPDKKPYFPVQAGAAKSESLGIIGDDEGENISKKNSLYNEMTVVYWASKNLTSDYVGLCHYRRYFSKKSLNGFCIKDKFNRIAIEEDYRRLLSDADVILPNKRKYYIETIESHFRNLPYTVNSDLDDLRTVIKSTSPQYLDAFEKTMNRTWAHMFNMFVMKKELLSKYVDWAFPILEEVEKRMDLHNREPVQSRMYVSEFLLDTWIQTNDIKYVEMPVVCTEEESLVYKGIRLLYRKLRKRKL